MFKKEFKVYVVTNFITKKQYVGITRQNIKSRWQQHCFKKDVTLLNRSIRKHGKDNFKIEIIFYAFSLDDMINIENQFIKQYNTLHPNGYNYKEGGLYGKFSEQIKKEMGIKGKERWKNNPEKFLNSLKHLKQYTDNKKEPVIGVHINTGEIKKYPTQQDCMKDGYAITSSLNRQIKHTLNYTWFYDEGFSDEFYKGLAEIQLEGFGTYKKNNKFWENKEHKEKRIISMKKGSKKKPLIAINIKDFSILEFESAQEMNRQGYKTGNVYQVLRGTCNQAYGYKWFHKDINKSVDYYINQVKK